MTITFKGEKMTLKKSVQRAVLVLFTGIALSTTFGFVLASQGIDESDITYKEVLITKGSSAFGEIEKLNKGKDARELVSFFEDKNDVDNAGYISEGYYLVPVLKGNK